MSTDTSDAALVERLRAIAAHRRGTADVKIFTAAADALARRIARVHVLETYCYQHDMCPHCLAGPGTDCDSAKHKAEEPER